MKTETEVVEKALAIIADFWQRSPAASILVALILIAMIVTSLSKIVDALAKALSAIADGARYIIFSLRRRSEQTQRIRRRSQFLKVLLSDLAAIAKAEAWNDQYFTDLEAEVEIEGGYYTGILKRLLKRKSFGRRLERSLIRAIEKSSEKCLLLTGDPGAGKSVALRHLACQIAERSMKRSRHISPIPLYINLRELSFESIENLTVNSIKTFVIDNVRRGDADTADYINANWNDFAEKGVWFFLFDSFDEIPAVMHAGVKEGVVSAYGNAIRAFMDGMGACRGVLASREYKRPPNNTWPKLKIMPLGERRQVELVNRTFLSEAEKIEVLRAVSMSSTATYANPLFLNLLCRYVKENHCAPKDEHELLLSHVRSLSRRDSDYVWRKWGLAPQQVLEGASSLAHLFATNASLGLSPTVEEINRALADDSSISASQVQVLVECLTYVKIGRTDVQSSDASVRRFAFAHRRYQECLVAVSLAQGIDRVDLAALLVDAQMREYLVAMLQVGDKFVVDKLTAAASRLVRLRIDKAGSKSRKFVGVKVQSFDWDDEILEHVLRLFIDAQRYHPFGDWKDLMDSVELLLSRVWKNGDYLDRMKVLKFCSLGGREKLPARLKFAISSGIAPIEEAALTASRFIVDPKTDLKNWVRQHVAGKLLSSRSRFDYLRWEALAVDLPDSYQLEHPIRRASRLMRSGLLFHYNRVLEAFRTTATTFLFRHGASTVLGGGLRRVKSELSSIVALLVYTASPVALAGFAMLSESRGFAFSLVGGGLLVLAAWVLSLAFRVVYFDCPSRLTISVVTSSLKAVLRSAVGSWKVAAGVLLALLLPGLMVLVFARSLGLLPDVGSFELVFLGSVTSVLFAAVIITVVERWRAYRSLLSASALLDSAKSLQWAFANASTPYAVRSLSLLGPSRANDVSELRSALAYLSAILIRLELEKAGGDAPGWRRRQFRPIIRTSVEKLLDEIELRRSKAQS